MVLFIRMLFLCLISKNRCLSIEGSIDSNIWRQTPSFICSIWRVSTSMWASTETNRKFFSLFFFYLFIWLFIYFFHFFIWNVFHFRRWFCRTIQYRAWLIFICHPFLNGFGALKPKFSVLNQFHRRKDVRNLPCNAHCIKYRFKIALYTTRRLCVWVCVCVRLVSMRIVCTDFGPNGR